METKTILDFLNNLSVNNSVDWMRGNKKSYELAKTECEALIQELINGISSFDGSVINLIPKDFNVEIESCLVMINLRTILRFGRIFRLREGILCRAATIYI
jgi:hypothetical protein